METFIIDDLPPEAVAMLQALYSRDPRSVTVHLDIVKKRGAEKFMATYYVGYGHKSIGDCGTTSLFIETVSLLAAKVIQDHPLYNGQEASTRYLDMSKQPLVDPVGTPESAAVQSRWMAFYSRAMGLIVPDLMARFPLEQGQDEQTWKKAVKAKAFDILRGFLPGGVTTLVAWHTNLRQAYDHLKVMRHHPLPEGKPIAERLDSDLKGKYPSSFKFEVNEAEERWLAESVPALSYYDEPVTGFSFRPMLDLEGLSKHRRTLETRPRKAELHQRLRRYGMVEFSFPLDFGSYRDLQRQRSLVQEMPLLSTRQGFFPWYLQQLPEPLRSEALDLIETQEAAIAALPCDAATRQYYVAIGYTVPVVVAGPLPAAVYVAELRSGTTVHPTLRAVAQRMGEALRAAVPGLTMHHDMSPDAWSIRRGAQDIVKKE